MCFRYCVYRDIAVTLHSKTFSHLKMKKINYLCIAGFVALYVVTVFATAFIGYLHPLCWVGFPTLAALLGAYAYQKLATRWLPQGAGTVLGTALGLLLLASGEGDVTTLTIMAVAGVLADVVLKLTHQPAYAYPVLAIGVISWLLPLWTRTQWYHDGAAKELGTDYAEGLMLLANWWGLLLVVAATALMAYLGIRTFQKH